MEDMLSVRSIEYGRKIKTVCEYLRAAPQILSTPNLRSSRRVFTIATNRFPLSEAPFEKEEHNGGREAQGNIIETWVASDSMTFIDGLVKGCFGLIYGLVWGSLSPIIYPVQKGGSGLVRGSLIGVMGVFFYPLWGLAIFCGRLFQGLANTPFVIKSMLSWSDTTLEYANEFEENNTQANSTGAELDSDSIFGVPLLISFQRARKGGYLHFLTRVINHIMEFGLYEENLFRVSASVRRIESAKELLDQESVKIELTDFSIHEVANLFKQFFMQLPEPIITHNVYVSLLQLLNNSNEKSLNNSTTPISPPISMVRLNSSGSLPLPIVTSSPMRFTTNKTDVQNSNYKTKLGDFRELLGSLPYANRVMLGRVVSLLAKISQNSSINKMTVSNLSVVFTPILLHENRIDYLGKGTEILSIIIGNYTELFTEDLEQL